MGWEFRLFYRVASREEFAHEEGSVEIRTDHYLRGTGPNCGVKRRGSCGGDTLEMKKMTESDSNGAERWQKTYVNESELPALLPGYGPRPPVKVAKRRFHRGNTEVVNVEVSVPGEDTQYWVSLCREGSKPPSDAKVERLRAAAPADAAVGGYPSWISTVFP